MLNIGWVDFSKSDRDMVMTVLRQLSEPGAMDELGIGTVRDAFSDILFPGTSTIQTRAKYLYIIPYLCLETERQGVLLPREFIAAIEQKELDLIEVLDKNGAEGVIGSRSKQTLRRKPSSIYWNALRTYGIFSELVTFSEYGALSYAQRSASDLQQSSGKRGKRDEDDTADDFDTGRSSFAFWRVPLPDKDWRKTLTIDLTVSEAIDLREKIITMPKTKDSLLALIIRESREDFPEFEHLSEIDTLTPIMPPEMRRNYELARDFSRFIFGAQVRYNVIYSEGQNTDAVSLWDEYIEERPTVDLEAVRARIKPKASVMRFLKQYQSALDDTGQLDKLIIAREKELKGISRAKLTNKELYQYDGSQTVNMEQLTYRLSNVQRIVKDIFEGVNSDA